MKCRLPERSATTSKILQHSIGNSRSCVAVLYRPTTICEKKINKSDSFRVDIGLYPSSMNHINFKLKVSRVKSPAATPPTNRTWAKLHASTNKPGRGLLSTRIGWL